MSEGNGSGHICWVGGSKGGVGKSVMTLATVDHLLEQGANVLLVEYDTSNPDVWKAYKRRSKRSSSTSTRRTPGYTSSIPAIAAAIASWSSTRRRAVTSPSSNTEIVSTAAWSSPGASSVALWVINRHAPVSNCCESSSTPSRRRPCTPCAMRTSARRESSSSTGIQDPQRGGEPRRQVDNAPRPGRSRRR